LWNIGDESCIQQSMIYLRTLIFNISFVLLSLGIGLFCLPIIFLYKDKINYVPKTWTRGVLWMGKVIFRIDHKIIGVENISQQAAIYASKHQSAWDTLIFWQILPHPVFVLKKELLSIPVFGHYLRHVPHIAIDRKAGASALKKIIADTKEHLNAGHQVIIFPEGTRSRNGVNAKYQAGIAALYSSLSATVIPVALNSGKFWGRGAFSPKKAGKITLQFLPAMPEKMDKSTFLQELQNNIETTTNLLE